MMNQPVFNLGFMDYSVLWIVNMEFDIRIVFVGQINQFRMKFENIVL